jgi:hypothetical protein
MLEMSREANVVVGVIGFCDNWLIRSVEIVTLNAFGSEVKWLIFWVNSLDSL